MTRRSGLQNAGCGSHACRRGTDRAGRTGLADAAQTVDDLEEKLDELQDGYDRLTLALESERSLRQQQDVEMAQLKERLAAAEDNARLREERHLEQKTSLQDALSKEQAQHKATGRPAETTGANFCRS
jgi:LPS O-antigen subunit length determinant protein (WzzB/FepE family)